MAGHFINLRSYTLKRNSNDVPYEMPETKRQRLCTSVDDLPPEVVELILKMVPSSDLLNCRKVNHKWHQISSEIMRQRSDVKLHFEFDCGEFMQKIQYRRCEALLVDSCETFTKIGTKSLTDLVECLANAAYFPFTNFVFDDFWKFWNCDIRSFLAVWGKRIVTLNIHIDFLENDVGLLRKLVFDRVQNLKKLEVTFSIGNNTSREAIPLSIQRSADSSDFQLPQLAIFCVNTCYHNSVNYKIVENILRAASNLKIYEEVHSFEENDLRGRHRGSKHILELLQPTNKLHCFQRANIFLSEELIRYWEKSPTIMSLKLRFLALSFSAHVLQNPRLKASAAAITSQLFHSSKDVIQTLSVEMLGSLSELKIPQMKKLQKLCLNYNDRDSIPFPIPLFNFADTFPNVQELVLANMNNSRILLPSNQQPMSKVEVLRISIESFGEFKFNEVDMKMTPNVKTLIVATDDFLPNGALVDFGKISKNWPKLENLGWEIDAITHNDLLHKLDALITGLSENFCKEISQKFRHKNRLSAAEVADYHRKRERSSILDLKELKRLDMHLLMSESSYNSMVETYDTHFGHKCGRFEDSDEGGFDSDSIYYKTGLTKVSKFLCFDHMPKLRIRIHTTFIE